MAKIKGWTKTGKYEWRSKYKVAYFKESSDGLGLILDVFKGDNNVATWTVWYDDFRNNQEARKFAQTTIINYMISHPNG